MTDRVEITADDISAMVNVEDTVISTLLQYSEPKDILAACFASFYMTAAVMSLILSEDSVRDAIRELADDIDFADLEIDDLVAIQ